MKLIVLDSGSKANGYVLTNGSEALIIEAGVNLIEVKKALGFNVSIIKGCIISHNHMDHSRYVQNYARNGISILAPAQVFIIDHNRNKAVKPLHGYKLGGFKILPFPAKHDVVCYGYVIEHNDCGRILFANDTYLVEYKFSDLNHIIIEANYADDILEKKISEGETHPSMRKRLMTSHMEIQTTKTTLQSMDLKDVINIILVHLSDDHSDEKLFKDEVIKITGKQVHVARKGLEVNLSKNIF